MTEAIEQLLGQIEGKVDGINYRLDSLNGSVGKLFDKAEANRDGIAEVKATCAERHREDVSKEKRTINFTFREFIIIVILLCTISVGGALTANALGV